MSLEFQEEALHCLQLAFLPPQTMQTQPNDLQYPALNAQELVWLMQQHLATRKLLRADELITGQLLLASTVFTSLNCTVRHSEYGNAIRTAQFVILGVGMPLELHSSSF
jgi:hypothetical protein